MGFRDFALLTALASTILTSNPIYAQTLRNRLLGCWRFVGTLDGKKFDEYYLEFDKSDTAYFYYWVDKKFNYKKFPYKLNGNRLFVGDFPEKIIHISAASSYIGDSLVVQDTKTSEAHVFIPTSVGYKAYVKRLEKEENQKEEQTYQEKTEEQQPREQIYSIGKWAPSPAGDLEFLVSDMYIDYRYHYSNQGPEDLPYLIMPVYVKNLKENVHYDFANSRLLDDQGNLWLPEINRYDRHSDEFAKLNQGQSSEFTLWTSYSKQWRKVLFTAYPVSGRYVFFLPTGDENFRISIGRVPAGLVPRKRK